jgi:hypothetical protein
MIDYPPHPGPLPLKGAREKRKRSFTLEVERKQSDILQQATEYEPIAKKLIKKENA